MNGNIGSESRARATLVAISSLELTADDSPLSGAASATVVLTALEDLLGATVVLWWERDIRGGRRARDPVASLGVHVDTLIPDDHVDRVGRLGIPERVHGVDGADRLVVPVVGKDGVLAVLDLVPRPGTPNFDSADLAAAIALSARLESSLTIWGLFDALQRQVDTDPLTGLPNRVALRGYLDAVLADASDKAGGAGGHLRRCRSLQGHQRHPGTQRRRHRSPHCRSEAAEGSEGWGLRRPIRR